MDEAFETFSQSYSLPGSPEGPPETAEPQPSTSGLKLVLPPLKGGKPVKGVKKVKLRFGSQGAQDVEVQKERRTARPVKLKPLKEVLTKLIAQIKKKDDYAFFLTPVDPSQIPGYSDVVKRPMDLGTMATKVSRGKYRSLEEFTTDFRLVTGNTKLFNPPGSIYHTEADRLEAWGLDHISKAASTVIQYETDWNIEIEKDDDGHTLNVDEDDEYTAGTPMDISEPGPSARSPSVASQVPPGSSRRGPRGPYKKTLDTSTLSESIDAEGRLPGSKDGLGAFPPGSHWAKTMLALKLKGKRYRTKKERMRIEKEGLPLRPDGSLDYTEVEDPFSILSVFAPDVESRPYVTPLYRPVSLPPTHNHQQYDPSQPLQPSASFPTAINLPPHHLSPSVPLIGTSNASNPSKRRHWVITRNAPTRSKVKEKDDDSDLIDTSSWHQPREVHAADFGSFALLAGELAEEVRRRGTSREGEEEEAMLNALRESVDCEIATKATATPEISLGSGMPETSNTHPGANSYWNTHRAAEAEDYIRDLVYGGVDGLAYVRSLAEFVNGDVGEAIKTSDTPIPTLGVRLSKWVEQEIVDDLTEGRHALLREVALQLSSLTQPQADFARSILQIEDKKQQKFSAQVYASLHLYPSAILALSALQQISAHKIDMGALIKTPEELFLSEEEWAGKAFKERRKMSQNRLFANTTTVDMPRTDDMEVEEPEKTWMDVDASATQANGGSRRESDYEMEGPEELNEVLEYVAGVIVGLDRKIKAGGSVASLPPPIHQTADVMKADSHDGPVEQPQTTSPTLDKSVEDPILRNLRLNLLALAKRAPLDTIARLPKDLVPEHIRHFVPTLGTTS